MRAASFVGRVGGLAVALGIGVAMTTGLGVAGASDTTGAGSQESSSAHDPAGSPATGSTPNPRSAATSRPSRTKGPLSKAADRVRENVNSGTAGTGPGAGVKSKITTPRRTRPGSQVRKDAQDSIAPSRDAVERTANPEAATHPETGRTGKARVRDNTDDRLRTRGTAKDTAAVQDSSPALRDAKPARRKLTPATPGPDNLTTKAPTPTDVPKAKIAGPADDSSRNVGAGLASLRREVDIPAVTDISAAVKSVARQFVAVSTPQAATVRPEPTAPRLVSGLLTAVGLAPSAGNSPAIPAQPPVLLALVAWARREFERNINPSGAATGAAVSAAPVATLLAEPATLLAAVVVDPNLQTPQPAAPTVGATNALGWVTGSGITTADYGTPGNYGIAGTDLGIMWDDGGGNVLMVFGDTFDQPNMTGVWRSNVLLRTVDHDLSDGLTIQDAVISPGGVYSANEWSDSYGATQVIRDPGFLGLFGSTTTIIPTAAISVTDDAGQTTQYANVMSVRTWDTPGSWTTNWSAIAYSTDDGKTWTVDPDTVRSSGWLRSSTPYVPGNQNFQQGAFVKGPADDVNADGAQYVYSFGTPSGRGGSAYVARVPETEIRELGAYEYWAGEDRGWVANDPSVAVPVIGATDQSPPTGFIGTITKAINDFLGGIVVGGLTGGNVSEISVQYNPYLQRYVALYTDGNNNVVMRVSDSPQGTWSDPTVLVANNPLSTNTGMYAPMIHPWSGTDQLGAENQDTLYWNLSYWGPYNVQLMETDLSPMGEGTGSGTVMV